MFTSSGSTHIENIRYCYNKPQKYSISLPRNFESINKMNQKIKITRYFAVSKYLISSNLSDLYWRKPQQRIQNTFRFRALYGNVVLGMYDHGMDIHVGIV